MTKKKVKRVDPRQLGDRELAHKWRRFYDAGAPVSLLMLGVFVIISGFVLCFNPTMLPGSEDGRWIFAVSLLEVCLLISVVSLAMGFYVAVYEPQVIRNHARGAVLLVFLLLVLVVMRIIAIYDWPRHLMVAPVLMLVIVLAIGYSQRFALGMGAFAAILSTIVLGEETLSVFLSICSGMGFSVLMLKEIRSRSYLIRVSFYTALVVVVMVWAVGFWMSSPLVSILFNSLWAGGSAIAVGFIMQGILPVIEAVFRTATAMTLQECGEASRPLLKRLAVAAPGTFNHSWQIGMLSEAAAEAIGANGILCRVGSYYHDVGKINKPRYFVENQAENFNQHRELSPTMSRMIIIGHVEDGMELAREYHLPRILHQFIACHHGTTLVEYFFHEATKKSAETGSNVPETEFRYPGPKPPSKEAAIVMIADAVEGATRAMQEPAPSRIENVVREIVMKRLLDGQFDNCDMTLKDLKKIEVSLIKSLCGMYHGRITYPKSEDTDIATKLNGATKTTF
ncbi:MAG: HDIG domain-containing protein [Sedimentisphaerales bacterium]|nr:HDIG domain-containing protein [Sedimentisphaerales bacterium]